MSPAQYAAYLSRKIAKLETNLVKAEQVSLTAAKRQAIKDSSGTINSTLAGYPYSRRSPNLRYNPSLINIRTGRLVSSWVCTGPGIVKGDLYGVVANTSPEAAFMEDGTQRMAPRRLPARVLQAIEPAREARLQRAADSALK